MTTERDLRNQMAWARKEAIEEGLAEGLSKGLAEGLSKGLAEGIAKGIAKGSLSKSLEIAGKMKELGVDISIIVQASGLSEEQILAL